jgi:16S rRNA (guanine527-N7)-methyltransferase
MISTDKNFLSDGIKALCKNDKDIERIVTTRGEEIVLPLTRYLKEIELFNEAYGLVGTNDTGEIIVRHILDSLAPLGIIFRLINSKAGEMPKIADAGSGAGLPGIPLAIALANCEFTLIERMKRRAGFLFNAKAVLGLSNIFVEESELEKIQSGYFDLMTFRAFKPLEPKLLKTLSNACRQGGIIAAYKGRLENTEQEMTKLGNICAQWEAIPYSVPFLEEERNLLVIRLPG